MWICFYFFLSPRLDLFSGKKERSRNLPSFSSRNLYNVRRTFGVNSFAEGMVGTYGIQG